MSKKPDRTPQCRDVINLVPEPFVLIDSNYQIVAANRNYCEKYDMDESEVVGNFCYKVSHHTDEPCHLHGEHCPLRTVFDTGQETEVIHEHFDKKGRSEHVQLRAQPILDDDGEVMYMAESIYCLDDRSADEHRLIGRSPVMMHLVSLLQRVAPTRTTVLLHGESGTGKEKVAEYLHHFSNCHEGPYIIVDSSTLGEQLIESELFGHEKGSFTGATGRKTGLMEAADKGTLFIDEISELPLPLQTKLLRFLETGTYRPVGGTDYKSVDVRIIAATNKNLRKMVEEGEFRNDLFFRLTAFPVDIPPLRERKDDIPALAEHFLLQFEGGENQLPLSQEVIEALLMYDYPGNVRELRNILERASILATNTSISVDHMIFEQFTYIDAKSEVVVRAPDSEELARDDSYLLSKGQQRLDRNQILNALRTCNGNRVRAATMLGVSERTMYRYVRKMREEMETST
jgi:transcriptional regulator with PAS, ATPase and Fis domain